jgi:hypothetical protein
MAWDSVDCVIPSFAAARVKLFSSATARNHSKSLKSCLGIPNLPCDEDTFMAHID